MALVVPEEHLVYIQRILELPEEKIQTLLDAIAKAGPKFNIYDLAADVSSITNMPISLIEGITQVLASLYLTRDSRGVSLKTFLDDQVGPALQEALAVRHGRSTEPAKTGQKINQSAKSDSFSDEEVSARWIKIRNFLIVALSLDDSLGTSVKAGHVLTEHERIFVDARIMTDIRPVFHSDISDKPNAAVIVHMLRITSRKVLGGQDAQYFALDINDVRLLKRLMDRAIKKEETVEKMMGGADVAVIIPKEVF